MRRVRLSIVSVTLTFVLATVLGATRAAGTTPAMGAALSVLMPGVLVSHDGGPFVAAADGEPLREGDSIRTGEGRAVLTYFEGSTVTIEPQTELSVDATRFAGDGGTIVLMTQLLGRTWNVVTKLITGGSRYEIRTPSTTASVRGTKFQVDAAADATTVSTTEGVVLQRVPELAGRTVDVPVPAGMTQTQRRGAAPAPVAPLPSRPRIANAVPRAVGVTAEAPAARTTLPERPAAEGGRPARLGPRPGPGPQRTLSDEPARDLLPRGRRG